MRNTDFTIGGKIKTLRTAQSLTQTDLAEILNVTQPTISTWESDVVTPTTANLRRLAIALNTTVGNLLDEVAA
jgi:transcriptional regulator with XRE-family HTH domain